MLYIVDVIIQYYGNCILGDSKGVGVAYKYHLKTSLDFPR